LEGGRLNRQKQGAYTPTDLKPEVKEIAARTERVMEKIFFPPCEPWCLTHPADVENWLEYHLDLEEASLAGIAEKKIKGSDLASMTKKDFVELGFSQSDLKKVEEKLFTPGVFLFFVSFS